MLRTRYERDLATLDEQIQEEAGRSRELFGKLEDAISQYESITEESLRRRARSPSVALVSSTTGDLAGCAVSVKSETGGGKAEVTGGQQGSNKADKASGKGGANTQATGTQSASNPPSKPASGWATKPDATKKETAPTATVAVKKEGGTSTKTGPDATQPTNQEQVPAITAEAKESPESLEARTQCNEIQLQCRAVEKLLKRLSAKRLWLREQYQSELRALDDLEQQLTSTTRRFESRQRRALESFLSHLEDRSGEAAYEELQRLHLQPGPTVLASPSPSPFSVSSGRDSQSPPRSATVAPALASSSSSSSLWPWSSNNSKKRKSPQPDTDYYDDYSNYDDDEDFIHLRHRRRRYSDHPSGAAAAGRQDAEEDRLLRAAKRAKTLAVSASVVAFSAAVATLGPLVYGFATQHLAGGI
ncbi:hypothetical protein HK102_003014 [Quaeritorhiza haematococci]|nr:hypothetical protein HK102_003014 [Quaeritorhiza haematococci]